MVANQEEVVEDQVDMDVKIPIQGKTCSSFGECCEQTAYNPGSYKVCLQTAALNKATAFLGQLISND